MFRWIAIFMAIFFSAQVFGQSLYVVEGNSAISKITFKGSTFSQQIISNPCDNYVGSIAVYKNNLFYVGLNGIKKATISSDSLTNCQDLGNFGVFANSLTVDKNGLLYCANGGELYRMDPVAKTVVKLGIMPYYSAGDLIFYKDDLYMASTSGIVKVNMSDPALSKLIIPEVAGAWGLASVSYSSTKNRVFVFYGSDVIEVDLDNSKVISKFASTNLNVYDAASGVEDGSIPKIEINNIKQYADCPHNGKGTVEVICDNALIDYTYQLNGVNSTTGKFSNLNPGTYNISVRSDTQVKDTVITVQKFLMKRPVLNIAKVEPMCLDAGKVTISTAANGDQYNIRYNNTVYNFNQTFSGLAAGSHRFIILNKAGCEVDTSDVILKQQLCKINVINVVIAEECNEPGKGSVQISTAPHAETYTYAIDTLINTTGVFNSLSPGTYQLSIAASNGDMKILPVIMPNYAVNAPIIKSIKKEPSCDTLGTVAFSIQNGNAFQYRIQLGGNIFPFNHQFNLADGSYQFKILKANNCLLTIEGVVLVRSKCTIKTNDPVITEECNLPGKAVVKVNVKPHPDSYTYTLNTLVTNSTGVFNNLSPGNYQVRITSPEDTKVVDIIVPNFNLVKPVISYTATDAVCDTPASVKLIMQNVNTGLYSVRFNNVVFSFDNLFNNLPAGTHRFEVLKQDGCVLNIVDVVLAKRKCEIQLDGANIQQECNLIFKGSVHVKTKPHTAAYTYKLGNTTNTTGVFNDLEKGDHTITVTSAEDQEQITAKIPDYAASAPLVTYKAIDAICEIQGSVKFTVAGDAKGYTVQLDNLKYPLTHEFKLFEGTYNFTIFKPDGCILNVYPVTLQKERCETLAFPNTFTPNNDGINDVFLPNQDAKAVNFKWKIFTRYGVLVFNSESSHTGWDGQVHGKTANTGVYYWVATYISNEGRALKKSGYVTLIR